MLTQREVLKLEKKLSQNRMNGKKPSNKTELAKELGTSRQQIYYCCHTEHINNSNRIENLLKKFINE
jgi:hypothetical protein